MKEVISLDFIECFISLSTGLNELIHSTFSIRALHCSERESTKNKMSLVELGKRLLDAAKRGDTDEVRSLMSNGAPFTTDWVSLFVFFFFF